MSRVPTVFIVNKGGHDYERAKSFGNLIVLTEGSINPFNPSRLALTVAKKINAAYEEDYLLLSGPPTINLIAGLLWLYRFKKLNQLIWSATREKYEVKTLRRSELQALVNTQMELAGE